MDASLCIGIFMLGAATGALLSRIATFGQLRRLRDEMGLDECDTTAAIECFPPHTCDKAAPPAPFDC